MAACAKCGSIVADDASFCNICGSPVSVVTSPVPPPPPPSPSMGAANAGMTSNVAGALAYLLGLVTGIIFLVLEPYKRDPFVRFHAFQSIFLNVVLIIFSIVWSNIITMMVVSIGFLWGLFGLIGSLVYLAFFIFWLFLMYKAYNRETFKIPIIGDIADKQAAKQNF
jgi:uncharacterized membrane protein